MRFKIPLALGKGNLPAKFQQFLFIQIELGNGKPNTNILSASHPFGREMSQRTSLERGFFSHDLQHLQGQKQCCAFAAFSYSVRFNCVDLPGHVMKRHIRQT